MVNITCITPDLLEVFGVYCIRNMRSDGVAAKKAWYLREYEKGLRLFIAMNEKGDQLGMIELAPAEIAWRPVEAPNFCFIQCLIEFSKESRGLGIGTALIKACEEEAQQAGKSGIFTLTSEGSWMAGNGIFARNGYEFIEQRGRFELWSKSFGNTSAKPKLLDYEAQQKLYNGWHLLVADQCPYHAKAILELKKKARERGISLTITKIETAKEAQGGPSGFGTFSLLYNGKLLADHYISATRFENILKKEINI